MNPAIKGVIGIAITVLESALAILTIIPGNQGEAVITQVIAMLKKLTA